MRQAGKPRPFYFPTSPRFAMIHRDAPRRRPFARRQNGTVGGKVYFAQDSGPGGPRSGAEATAPRLLSRRNPVCAPLLRPGGGTTKAGGAPHSADRPAVGNKEMRSDGAVRTRVPGAPGP